jgi:integrase
MNSTGIPSRRKCYQHGCVQRKQRRKGPDVYVLRYRQPLPNGSNKLASVTLGTVEKYPSKKAADVAAGAFQLSINVDTPCREPISFGVLIEKFAREEMPERYSSRVGYLNIIDNYIKPRWGNSLISEVRPGAVQQWLKTLHGIPRKTMRNSLFPQDPTPPRPLAPRYKRKIKYLMRRLFDLAMLWELIPFGRNPISLSRVSSAGYVEKEPRALSVEDCCSLLQQPELQEEPFRTMVICAMLSGLRRSELFALKWNAIDWTNLKMKVTIGIIQNHVDDVKTTASRASLPIEPALAEMLRAWRLKSPYPNDTDWVFASPYYGGRTPYLPETILRTRIKPAALRIGLGEIGWHTFRHTYSTLLRGLKVDVKAQQLLMRHKNPLITLGIYTHEVPGELRKANRKLTQLLVPAIQRNERPLAVRSPLDSSQPQLFPRAPSSVRQPIDNKRRRVSSV